MSLIPWLTAAALAPLGPDCLFEAGEFARAQAGYQRLRLSEKQLWALLRQDHWQEAIVLGERVAPQTAEGEGLLALAYLRGGQPARALESARWAAERDPVAYWPKVALGTLASRWRGDHEAALLYLRQAVTINPRFPEGWLALLAATPDLTEARYAESRLLQLAPKGYPFRTQSSSLPSALFLAAFPGGQVFIPRGSPPEQQVLPLKRDLRGMLYVEVKLDGHSFRLLYDTGGGRHLVLTPSALERLKPTFVTSTVMTGVQGWSPARLFRAERLQLGSMELRSLVIESAPANLGGFDGLVGWRVLGELVQRIEPERGTLTLSKMPLALTRDARCLPLHLIQDQPVVGVECRPEGKREPVFLWSFLDTGSTDDFFSLRMGALLAPTGRHRTRLQSAVGLGKSQQQVELETLPVAFDVLSERGELLTSYTQATAASFLDKVLNPAMGFEHGLLLGMEFLSRFKCIELNPLQRQVRLVPQ